MFAHAGQLTRSGTSQTVAVKIVELAGCTPAQVASANKEVAVLCQISKRLGSCVVDFLGFQTTQSERLLIVMKLARKSLMSLISESGKVPVDRVVRPLDESRLPACLVQDAVAQSAWPT